MPFELSLPIAQAVSLALTIFYWGTLIAALVITHSTKKMPYPAIIVIFLISTLALLATLPGLNGDLRILPDSLEQTVGAIRWIESGSYAIQLGDLTLPPRYPPFFSLAVIAPFIWAFGPNLGNAVIPGLLHLVFIIIFASRIGLRFGGPRGAIGSVLSVLLFSPLVRAAGEVLTHVPSVLLTLILLVLYLEYRTRPSTRFLYVVWPLLFFAVLLRPLNAALVIPWLLMASTPCILLCISAPLLAGALSLLYNSIVFGTPARNGYHFWTALPYDFLAQVFDLSFFSRNALALSQSGGLALLLLAGITLFFRRRYHTVETAPALTYVLLAPGSIAAIHSFYFFPSTLFFLPLITCLSAVAAGSFGFQQLKTLPARMLGIFAVLLILLTTLNSVYRVPPVPKTIIAQAAAEILPLNSYLISGLDPLFLQSKFVGSTQRRIIPVSRRIEYASKFLARYPLRISTPPPTDPASRAEWLLTAGAEDVYVLTAIENMPALERLVTSGQPVFLETLSLRESEKKILAENFTLLPTTHEFLWQVANKTLPLNLQNPP